ncbi:MAG: LPD5 domain-containing protein, partial [Thiomicrorhabdus sp.]|nr:LPD5 domain-containing protein [Thiomicrorhabdus sp.]
GEINESNASNVLKSLISSYEVERKKYLARRKKNQYAKSPDSEKVMDRVNEAFGLDSNGWSKSDILLGSALMPVIQRPTSETYVDDITNAFYKALGIDKPQSTQELPGLVIPKKTANIYDSTVRTKTGRITTVFPSAKQDPKNFNVNAFEKEGLDAKAWLAENAEKEAIANGDTVAENRFGSMWAKRMSGDDVTAASAYLFDRKHWTDLGDLVVDRGVKLAQSGKPFASEKSARLSKTFKETTNAELVPVDGGFGVREGKVKSEPTYVSRPVVNADEIVAWANEQGFNKTLSADDMHVTVVYSRDPIAIKPTKGDVSIADGKRTVEPLGEDGAVVLKFESKELQDEWKAARDAGASWDYESYTPHVTITYDGGDIDVKSIKPFTGEIKLGGQVVEALNEDAVSTYKEVESNTSQAKQVQSDKPVVTDKPTETPVNKGAQDSAENATTTKPAPKEVQSQEPVKKIEDFGEKLEGAKKFTYTFNEAVANEIDTTAVPLSKSFPKPDIQKLIDGGVSKLNALRIAVLRESIPTKPRKGYKLARWVKSVDAAREVVNTLMDDTASDRAIRAIELSPVVETANTIGDSANDLTADQIEALSKVTIVRHKMGVTEKSIKDYSGNPGVEGLITGDYYNVSLPNGRTFNVFEQKDNAIEFAISELENLKVDKAAKFDIYSFGRPPFTVGKKIASGKYLDYKGGFATANEARGFIKDNNALLVEWLANTKKAPAMRKDSDSPRIGEDYRNDKPVTAELFAETFGFRGVQFGNWVEDGKRQSDLNNAFDGLVDLANIIGVPPKALSLNGELGLAFGARGAGGKNPAKAHYETGKVVINLTKKDGAGSLAHEWFHAMDNYFSKQDGGNGFSSESFSRSGGIRPEVFDAWTGLRKSIVNETKLVLRSSQLDKSRSKDYWSTMREIVARSFERYVIDKLAKDNYESDYLANIVSQEYWDIEQEIMAKAGVEKKAYPYPLDEEADVVNKAYDNLFDVIETKETDSGVAMFSRSNSFAQVKKELSDSGIKASISERDAEIFIGLIEVPKSDRNNGMGTKAMQSLVDYADSIGKRVVLTPSSDFGGSKTRLVEFYKRFGFVENKGKNKDYEISESMYRSPLFSRDSSTLAANSTKGSLAVEVINSRVADLNLELRLVGSEGTVQVHTDLSSLPNAIKAEVTKQGAENDFAGVYHSGKVHIYAPHIKSELHLEEVILHELEGHFGFRKLFGKETADKAIQGYNLLGGEAGIKRFLSKHNIKMDESYFTEANTRQKEYDKAAKQIFLFDEFMAHIAGHKAKETLPQGINRRLNEYVSLAVKKLREYGFNKIADFMESKESTVYGTLRQMRQATYENVETGDIGGSSFMKAINKDNGKGSPEYEAAKAKGLDMSHEARMQRARDMGFDTDTVYYHNSSAKFSEFKKGNSDGLSGDGIYFSEHPLAQFGSNQYEVFLKLENPITKDNQVDGMREINSSGIPVKMKKNVLELFPDHDGIKNRQEVVVRDSSQIRSINAAFGPEQSDSGNILFSRKGPTKVEEKQLLAQWSRADEFKKREYNKFHRSEQLQKVIDKLTDG